MNILLNLRLVDFLSAIFLVQNKLMLKHDLNFLVHKNVILQNMADILFGKKYLKYKI